MARLAECVAACRGGRGALVLVMGEPGVGKTRLAIELGDLAVREGATVVWGRCREDGGTPPYHPWVQVLQSAAVAAGVLPDHIRRGWPEAASLVSGGTLPAAISVDPSHRFRLFASVAALLAECARHTGLVAILDDLHRADEGSLALLRFLAPELSTLPVLVIATYRDSDLDLNHPLLATIGYLADEAKPGSIRLDGLHHNGVAELLERHAGPLPVDVVDTVASRTGGNPLFVIELAMLLRSAAGQEAETARSALPATVQDVVRKRVERLPPETQRTLRAAAVLGRDFGRLPLAAVLDASQLAAVAALQPAAAARLISSGPQAVYRFTHALVQAAIYATLPLEERTALHRRATDAIAALGAIGDERLNDLAFHSYHAALDGDLEPAYRHTLAAARRARQRLAFEDAARWYSLTLDIADRQALPVSDPLDLLMEAADADVSAGRAASAGLATSGRRISPASRTTPPP